MKLVRRPHGALALLFLVLALVAAGCGGPPPSQDGVSGSEALPRWVRIVPVEGDGRSWYVGAVSMASSAEAALDEARLDALSQISRKARERFAELVTQANAGSGVTLTALQRFQLSDVGRERYSLRLERLAAVEETYMKPCSEGGETVCRAFVLVGLPLEAWGRELAETLEGLRREEAEAGREDVVEYIDWMLRNLDRPSH
jgi:hypothetical protein